MDIKLVPHGDAVPDGPAAVSGDGWLGASTLLIDSSGHRPLHCMTARLTASKSTVSVDMCCVGSRRAETAEELLQAIEHRRAAGLLNRLFAREPARLPAGPLRPQAALNTNPQPTR